MKVYGHSIFGRALQGNYKDTTTAKIVDLNEPCIITRDNEALGIFLPFTLWSSIQGFISKIIER